MNILNWLGERLYNRFDIIMLFAILVLSKLKNAQIRQREIEEYRKKQNKYWTYNDIQS